ncbi:hypothetical protein LCGC14_1726850 [marine sediment metagenome]|uniref:Uncharacterized protein n=1 Tax=marine sediment metagenome TaxID=412755 RepID=A0A0F9HAI9_9ZZZZ
MNLLFEINEKTRKKQSEKKTQQTQTKTAEPGAAPDLSAFERGMEDLKQGTQNVPQQKTWADLPDLKRSTAAQTRQKLAGITAPEGADEKLTFLQRLGLEDEISDEEAAEIAGRVRQDYEDVRPEPVTPGTDVATIETMPAVVNKEIAKHAPVEPEWHQVKHLPGYLAAAIRAMGRQVFSVFTNTRIEDIQVIANLSGQGPNSEREMDAVAGWLKDNGVRDTDGEMNFQQSIPDYGAEFQVYNADKFTFMLVDDEYGNYVYSWPTEDNKNFSNDKHKALT